MYITYGDIQLLFSDYKGYNDQQMVFETISFGSLESQRKGLFVPIGTDDLLQAIHNGAIAAVWEKRVKLPRYTPNDFPVFFVDNINKAALIILEEFVAKNCKHKSIFLINENDGTDSASKIYNVQDNHKELITLMDDLKRRAEHC